MIGLIDGILVHKSLDTQQATILAGSVGYEAFFIRQNLERLELNTELRFFIHTHVREDILSLYAFSTEEERSLFRILMGVSGLGPKTALSRLNDHGADKLVSYILARHTAQLTQAQGVGKKLADRIVLELQPKLEKMKFTKLLTFDEHQTTSSGSQSALESVKQDLTSALTNLGYTAQQVKLAIERVVEGLDSTQFAFEKLLKMALNEISGRTLSS